MWWCNQCGTGDGFELLKLYHGWNFGEAKRAVGGVLGKAVFTQPKKDDEARVRRSLNAIREEAGFAGDVPEVRKYLEGRGLAIPPNLQAHPALPYYEGTDLIGRYPAMLGKMLSPGGRPVGYHRTYLRRMGKKAPLGSPRKIRKLPKTQGYAIRLWPATDTVAIAEGIETAIACYMLWGVPAWSVISADDMKKFEPPAGVRHIIIAGDNDESHVGQAAAHQAAEGLIRQQYRATVKIPDTVGDWNDYLETEI